jgi:hypothetical protein
LVQTRTAVGLCFCPGQMDDDADGLCFGKLSRPTDDEFLGLAVEVALAKGKRIKGVKQLRDGGDLYLDGGVLGHGVSKFPWQGQRASALRSFCNSCFRFAVVGGMDRSRPSRVCSRMRDTM